MEAELVEQCRRLGICHVAQSLQRLCESGFVVRLEGRGLQRINGWCPLHEQLVAVELKLSRVAEALAQAEANLAFASESYVAVPWGAATAVAESKRAQDFVQTGIGLVGVGERGCGVLIEAEPDRAGYPAWEAVQIHCVEQFWPMYVRGT